MAACGPTTSCGSKNPERLADALAFRELPAGWMPVYVESYDYGPPLVPVR